MTSQERRHSMDHVQRREQCSPFVASKARFPEKSCSVAKTHFQHCGGTNKSRNSECFSDNNVRFLEDLEDPRFSDLPPESSFDEVRCVMASSPYSSVPDASTEAKKLDELRSKIVEVIRDGDLRKQMIEHIGQSEVNPPLPRDTHKISSPPEKAKDVVAQIKKIKSKPLFKEPEEKQRVLERPKVTRRDLRNLKDRKNLTRKVLTLPKRGAEASATLSKPKTAPEKVNQMRKHQKFKRIAPTISLKKCLPQNTGFGGENASQVLNSQQLGIRKPNSTLTASSLRPIPLPSPKMPTYANILERISAIRSRTKVVMPVRDVKKRCIFLPRPQDESEELDDFEVLEELYGAVGSNQSPHVQQNICDLRKRINVLQQKLLQSPLPMEPFEKEELDEYEALEQQLGGTTSFERPVAEHLATDLQVRINALKETLFQSPTRSQSLRYDDLQQNKYIMTAAAAETGLIQRTQNPSKARLHSPSPAANHQNYSIATTTFQTDVQPQNVEAKKMYDADFEIEDGDCLEEVTMPALDEEVSFDEFGIADISTPDFCNLSISDCELADFQKNRVSEKGVTEKISQLRRRSTSTTNTTSKTADVQSNEKQTKLELDTSLPTIFATTPSIELHMSTTPKAQTVSQKSANQKLVASEDAIAVPAHRKNSMDYKTIVKRAQEIEMQTSKKSASSKDSSSFLPNTVPAPKRKASIQTKTRDGKRRKIYPPGEYSPSYTKAVARARNLAGLQNLSAALNPERAAKVVVKKAKLTDIDALPTVERLRAKMSLLRAIRGVSMPYVGDLATDEASLRKTKYGPEGRIDRHMKPSETRFSIHFGDISPPAEEARKNWKELSVLSSHVKEPEIEVDLINFSPLKPHEGLLRLRYLKDQALRLAVRAAKENKVSPIAPMQLSEIRLDTPGTEATRTPNTIKTTIESGNAHISTKRIATENDRYEYTTCDPQKELSWSGDDLANIEPPEFSSTLSTIPTTNEIINTIRLKIKANLNRGLTNFQHSLFSPSPAMVAFPHDLPDENLFEVKIPEFEKTPREVSPHLKSISPIGKDAKMNTTQPPQMPTAIQKIQKQQDIWTEETSQSKRHLSKRLPSLRQRLSLPVSAHTNLKDSDVYKTVKRRARNLQQRFDNPCIGAAEINTPKSLNPYDSSLAGFKYLDEFENLSEIEQPSLIDTSICKYQINDDQYLPLTPPQTPPHNEKQAVTSQESPTLTPKSIGFPETLPEEQLSQQNAPSFAKTTTKFQTPITTANISIPVYFKESPPINKNIKTFVALRAKRKLTAPPTRELSHKQRLMVSPQTQQRKRLLNELEQLRQQQGFQALKTPAPAEERLKSIKSRLAAEKPTSSALPYSPVKTPAFVDSPQFEPLTIPQTPPFPFLENVLTDDIADISMPLDDIYNCTVDRETTNEEDLEFELAEIANEAYELGERCELERGELDKAKDAFNISERIRMLQQQLLQSSDEIEGV